MQSQACEAPSAADHCFVQDGSCPAASVCACHQGVLFWTAQEQMDLQLVPHPAGSNHYVVNCADTPLLPAVATGTVEDRSIVEPVRRIITGKVGRAPMALHMCSKGNTHLAGVIRRGSLSCGPLLGQTCTLQPSAARHAWLIAMWEL